MMPFTGSLVEPESDVVLFYKFTDRQAIVRLQCRDPSPHSPHTYTPSPRSNAYLSLFEEQPAQRIRLEGK